jgi:hypothetical protein
VRLVDLDLDGICELVVANPAQQAVYRLAGSAWEAVSWSLPDSLMVADASGRDGGLRFVDLDGDGHLDLVFSNAERTAVYVYASMGEGWSRKVWDDPRTAESSLPMIVRADGTNNGAWFKNGFLWVQNEDTGGVLPHHVDARPFPQDLLRSASVVPAVDARAAPPPAGR